VEPMVDRAALLEMREHVRSILVAPPIEEYVVSLVRATRARKEVRIGGSPRASVALYRAAQALAFLDGRDFVLPDDVKSVAPAVLGHRVVLDLDYSLRGSSAVDIVKQVIASVGAPPPPTPDGEPERAVQSVS
jgi:MoxR-like ATPase